MTTTAQTKTLEEIAQFIDLVQQPIFVVEIVGDNFLYRKLNKKYEQEVGLHSGDIENKSTREFLPARVADTVEDNYLKCIALKDGYEYDEILTLKGVERWWSTTLSPVADETGAIRYIIGTCKDITVLKKSGIALTKENATLRRQNDDINTLTAIAAHDLRPAIHNVKTFAEIVMDGFHDMGDGKLQKIETIHSIGDILSEYVERVLTHARSINLRETEAGVFEMEHLVRDIIAASDPNSDLDISCPSGFMEGEEVVIQIILRNLIDNATRFATSRIAVAIEESADHPGMVVLSISDDGPGFRGGADAFQEWMLNDGNRHMQTSGFGLHAVQQLAQTREGRFWLDTPRLGGTTFRVALPGALVHPEDAAIAA